MAVLPFRPDQKLTDVLQKQSFTVSAEVLPPRNGSEQGKVLDQIDTLIQAGAQFLAVTKGAGGSLRGGSLPIAQVIKEQFKVPCIAHFTCRDLTIHDVENQLMDHHYFGIRNILALRGDPPDGQPQWKAREGGYDYAYQLIEQIRNLNEGAYLTRANGPKADGAEKTDFCIGAAAYPEHADPRGRIEYFKIKVDKGAQFGITDMLYDTEAYARFLEGCDRAGVHVPVLPATRILKSRGQAERMMSKFKVNVPAEIMNKLPAEDGPGAIERGIEIFMNFVEKLRRYGAPGIHVYVIVDTIAASQAIRQLATARKDSIHTAST